MLRSSWENIGWVTFNNKRRRESVVEHENCSLWLKRSFGLRKWKWNFAQMDGSLNEAKSVKIMSPSITYYRILLFNTFNLGSIPAYSVITK